MTIAELKDAVQKRHSVRQYLDKPIPGDVAETLQAEIDNGNAEGELHMQLVLNEPKAFDSFLSHYGKFRNVSNYLALIGPKSETLDEKLGYYGERVVLLAQQLGLNSCWVGLTYAKVKTSYVVGENEKLVAVVALGYGATQGVPHRSKSIEEVATLTANADPEWYLQGIRCALLAPTATNQQKFHFSRIGHRVSVKAGVGFFSKMDLGIVKYHFEIGASDEDFEWA
ncbi:MAG: nitroreductase [Bacteroidaceae bacterium]|nr:nitroreductase [Bacteroidaceae bacterium]